MRDSIARRTATGLVIGAGVVLGATISLYAQSSSTGSGQTGQTTGRVVIIHNPDGARRPPRRLADMTMRVPPDNPITDAKAALGKRLFFDPILSSDRSVSCATCHDPERAFADSKALAVGVFGRVGKRHSPALVNRGFGRTHFWDGRSASLEDQVLQPIVDPNEMDLSIDDAVARLAADDIYTAEFSAVFNRAIVKEDVAKALATFLRTIRSGDSAYDRFVGGEPDALTAEQQRGLQIFRTKARCTICHLEPLFTDEQFHNTGVAWRPASGEDPGGFLDDGRYAVSKLERDRGRFKTPTLRDAARTAPYMHDGSLATLDDVVEFYNQGGRRNPNLFPAIEPLRLTSEEKQALVRFLESLTGK